MRKNPIKHVAGGWRWGSRGTVYRNRSDAVKQAQAAYAHGYRHNPLPRPIVIGGVALGLVGGIVALYYAQKAISAAANAQINAAITNYGTTPGDPTSNVHRNANFTQQDKGFYPDGVAR